MKYIVRDDLIDVLDFSVRTYNSLRRTGIHTVGDFLDYPIDKFKEIRNLGHKSISEIEDCLLNLKNNKNDFRLEGIDSNSIHTIEPEQKRKLSESAKKYPETAVYFNAEGNILQDIPIKKLALSNRAVNGLLRSNIWYASQLLGKPQEELYAIKNLGSKTIAEIISVSSNINVVYLTDGEINESKENPVDGYTSFTQELSSFYGESEHRWIKEFLSLKDQYPNVVAETLLYRLYERDFVRDIAKTTILKILECNNDEVSRSYIDSHMPPHLSNTTIIEELLLELEADDKITLGEVIIYRKYPSVIQYVSSLPEGTTKTAILERLKGKTLQEIAESMGNLSRERVRQIINRGWRQKPRLREDQYQYIYETYCFSKDAFSSIFDEPIETYYYLEMVSNRLTARHHIEDIIEDPTVPKKIKKNVEKELYKNYVTIEGVPVKKTRLELVPCFIKIFCDEFTKYDQFVELYHIWLDELGLSNNENLKIDGNTVRNRLYNDKNILWNFKQGFRYYNYNNYDFTELLDTLNLEQYQDVEISTLKLFKDFPELMSSYDIRDEFELHNLLKKIYSDFTTDVKFGKMPTIEIGIANRDEQVYSLMLQYAPISADELAQKYEEEYGVKAGTVLANYLKNFSCYFDNGVFNIDTIDLPNDQFERIKNILVKDFYTIKEVQHLYLREFPKEDKSNINSYTLKTLGFRTYSGYIVRNTYSSASEYFRYMLLNDDIVDLRDTYKDLIYFQMFDTELYNQKAKRNIIEFAPHQYLNIRRLNSINITTDDIEDYCNAVKSFVEKGELFTIYSLRKKGFRHSLDELGFDDWFYASLLCEDKKHFSYKRLKNSKLFMCGTEDVNIYKLVSSIILREQKMDIFDLVNLIEEVYDLSIPKEQILEQVKSTDLYYDSIMETIYIDYFTYFEEI